MLPPKYQNNLATGCYYYAEGLRLIWRPELRPYLLVPLLVNGLLFVVLTCALFQYMGGAMDTVMNVLPTWLEPLAMIAWVLIAILLLIIYGYSFNMITNIIAAPFYGILAQKVEELLTGEPAPEESLWRMVPRVMLRELSKLIYFLSRGIVVVLIMLLVSFIPVIQVLAPFIGLAWSAWTMAIQYTDYATDNHQRPFKTLRQCLWRKKFSCAGFGSVIMLCSITPIVNIFAMPAAVALNTRLQSACLALQNHHVIDELH